MLESGEGFEVEVEPDDGDSDTELEGDDGVYLFDKVLAGGAGEGFVLLCLLVVHLIYNIYVW